MSKRLAAVSILVCFLAVSSAIFAPSVVAQNEPMGAETEDLVVISPEVTAQIQLLQAEVREKGYHFTVGYNPALKYSLEELCGLVEPPDWRQRAPLRSMLQAPLASQPLPSAFDWRALNGVTPVRNQRSCGSCWAFGTVAVLESALKIRSGVAEDLSEQYLISCNESGWDCEGGWWAHDYHQWRIPAGESSPGAVLESDFPYSASDELCDPPHPHMYLIDSWGYVDPSVYVPSVEQIKHAIYNCGPVGAAVYVGSLFQGYTGGVFDANEAPSATKVNHAVVLVGWNDDYYGDGSNVGVWILRNSWGSWWGEGGYMNITYGTSNVGYRANYILLPPLLATNCDFDTDGKNDVAVYHGSSGQWFVRRSSDGSQSNVQYGGPGYVPVAADFDGDGVTDVTVYHVASGVWYVTKSSDGTGYSVAYGGSSYSPVPGDYDGDGSADIAVYHESSGLWYILRSSDDTSYYVGYGGPGYCPVPGDYDGDGKIDVAVYHASSGLWYIRQSSDGSSYYVGYGGSSYVPVPGDYDGDGKADIAVYYAASGLWYIRQSSNGSSYYVAYGGPSYAPVPGDYDGDGIVDMAVYYESSGLWYIRRSSDDASYYVAYGGSGYTPVNPNYLLWYTY